MREIIWQDNIVLMLHDKLGINLNSSNTPPYKLILYIHKQFHHLTHDEIQDGGKILHYRKCRKYIRDKYGYHISYGMRRYRSGIHVRDIDINTPSSELQEEIVKINLMELL